MAISRSAHGSPMDLWLSQDAFVRSTGVNRQTPHLFLLGAGASVTSGLPSAWRCIWEWKREIFVSNHPQLADQFRELTLPSVQERIQSWLDRQSSYPVEGAPEEYGVYIEACFPEADDRRRWFQEKIKEGRPHVGYKALCALAESGFVDSVWTTNFDQLVARAAADFNISPIEVGLDSTQRIDRPIRSDELLIVSLHGDYRYDHIRNTEEELREQEAGFADALVHRLRDRPLIVAGYSGRDKSLMDVLGAAYSDPSSAPVYWFVHGDSPAEEVENFARTVREKGGRAHLVRTTGFDDTLCRVALQALEGKRFEHVRKLAADKVKASKDRKSFQAPKVTAGTVIKSNAFEVHCPRETFDFGLSKWPERGVWSWLREMVRDREVIAIPHGGRVLALGEASEIRSVFGQQLKGPVAKTPISEHELRYEDGPVTSLMLTAIVQSLASQPGLESDGRRMIWLTARDETQTLDGSRYNVHEAAQLYLRRIARKHHLVLKPSVRVLNQNGERVEREIESRVRMKVLGYQHNHKFNQAMEGWRKRLFGKAKGRLTYPPDSEDGFEFKVRPAPAFAALQARDSGRQAPITAKLQNHVRQFGFELPEPELIFSTGSGVQVKDVHPIRGIVRNRPYDYALSNAGFASSVRLGVICPARDSEKLSAFLNASREVLRRADNDRDYMLDFPGFHEAWGVPLQVPSPGDEGWIELPEPAADSQVQSGALELARSVTSAIDALRASYSPCVALVYVPDRFERWKRFETEHERFDLHDFTKAHCVPRGMSSQFLEEHTIRDRQRCRVWWWLSLALYVKSMRTPWVLDSLDDDTAYVGLGFSVDSKAERGNHVVLGCSHIYNSRGEGLQYRLTKIEDPVLRQGNPFMSRDDSRRVGDTIRQLFYESHLSLPSRVVVHKRTPFQRDEREGLFEGLGGVDEVDMLEINLDPALRYVASKPVGGGKVREDRYPVDRGSVVKLDNHTALAWVHGVAEALDPRLKYYQGKRRIPAPLVLRRAAGASDLETLCAEILGLSKMDWNSFDLYTKLPSTIGSSSRIARIGALLERFGSSAYDYRLFI